MSLGIVDIVLLTFSLLASAAIGIYNGIRGIKSTPLEYLLGGRSMSPLPLAMSMTVGTVSAITIMGNAGEMYVYGTQLWLMDLGIVIGMVIVANVFMPIMYPLKMVSMYQYIERRFKSIILRRVTAVLQLGGGYLFIGFLLYPPSIALKVFTGLSIMTNIFIMGITCTLYSTFGGVKAVVYADVLQSLVMVAGVLAIVIQGSIKIGGLDKVWDIAYHHDRLEFFNMNLDPYQRHSFWLCTILGLSFALSTYGVTQSQTQRCFSTGSVEQSKWVLYYAAIGMVFLKGIINIAGLVIFAYYADCDPFSAQLNRGAPSATVIITYVLQVLTKIPGIAGLFVAAIYAAVLSSVSTQLNSMAALLWEDFLKVRPSFANWSDIKIGRLQKILVFASGALGLILGILVSQLGKSFLETLYSITGAISGPQIGLFLVAVFMPFVNAKGASAGLILSIILSLWISIGQLVTQSRAEYLPFPKDGCPVTTTPQDIPTSVLNSTDFDSSEAPPWTLLSETSSIVDDADLNSTILPSTEETVDIDDRGTDRSLYAISYCLNSLWGALSCIIVSLIASVITGTNFPEDVDKSLVAPRSWSLFEKFSFLQGREPVIKTILKRSPYMPPSESKRQDVENAEEKGPLPEPMTIQDPERVDDGECRGAV